MSSCEASVSRASRWRRQGLTNSQTAAKLDELHDTYSIPKLLVVCQQPLFLRRLPLFLSYCYIDSWPALACSEKKKASSRCGMFCECFEWFHSPAAHTYPHLSTRTREVETLRQPLENVWWDYHAVSPAGMLSLAHHFRPSFILEISSCTHKFVYFPQKFFYQIVFFFFFFFFFQKKEKLKIENISGNFVRLQTI